MEAKNGDIDISVAGQSKVNDKLTVKAKVNKALDLALASKYKVNSTLTVTASANVALSKGAEAVDFKKFTPLPLGF